MLVCIMHAVNIVTNALYSLLPPPLFAYRAISVCVHVCVGRTCLSLCVCVCPTLPSYCTYVHIQPCMYVRSFSMVVGLSMCCPGCPWVHTGMTVHILV